jgi:hypothetical protein
MWGIYNDYLTNTYNEPLNHRRKLMRLKAMYKVDKKLTPNYLRGIFPSKFSSYNTRNTLNYSVPKCKLQIYKHSFVPTVINELNFLPENIKTSESVGIFISKVKTKQSSPPVYFACGNRRFNRGFESHCGTWVPVFRMRPY